MAESNVNTLVGIYEAAALLGVSRQCFCNWRARGWAPTPLVVLHCGPIWTLGQINELKVRRKRLAKLDTELQKSTAAITAQRAQRNALKMMEAIP